MGKSIAESEKAKEYEQERIGAERANKIDLSTCGFIRNILKKNFAKQKNIINY